MSATTDVALPVTRDRRGFTWFDSFFGVLMPIICFAVDLSFMSLSLLAPLAFWGVAFLGIFGFIVARFKLGSVFREIILGMLWSSAAVAALIGVALVALLVFMQVKSGGSLPPLWLISFDPLLFAILGGVMSLALVPFFTAKAFYNRAAAVARRPGTRSARLIAVGALIVVGFPLTAHFSEYRWLNAQFAAVRSDNSAMRFAAIRALNKYPLTLGRADYLACDIVNGTGKYVSTRIEEPSARAAVMQEVEQMVGSEASKCRSS